ncbi:MAG: hypothetical protein KHZ99_06005 [Clostridium sp.]|uniref:hypothetical protein n=1 Tax=Clostridium sp. TaxID=1506 RepID=UPI0025C46C23|nr:hypothetical protein [Clostridium sp.]MBS4956584.1 hypothetical protein [Clostridium sp.]
MEEAVALNRCVTATIQVLIKNNLVTKEEFLEIVKNDKGDLTEDEMLEILECVSNRLNLIK